jgi:hypothetical protein
MKVFRVSPAARALFREVSKCDDKLGKYADYEGTPDDGAPTATLWVAGYELFAKRCEEAIADHAAAITVWRKLRKLNEKRKKHAAQEGKGQ